uniref:Uncharacterized protein n=1 Tax=Aegilops tauschii subsp. strangulata TaxID=200361 RepID=A0A452Y0L5_AEGTS
MTEAEDIMSDVEIDELYHSMKDELQNCFSTDIPYDSGSGFCLIPRIHEHIRAIDRYSYEPIILSIGPYHNGSPALSSTEREKWNRLDYVLKLNCEKGLKDYLTVINRLEKRTRMCYSGDIKMSKKDFLQTLLLDGCFVLVSLGKFNEFIRPELHSSMPSSSHAEVHEEDLISGHSKVTGINEIQEINTRKLNATKSTVIEQDIVPHNHSREENSVLEIELCPEISGHKTGQCLYPDNAQQIGQWYDVYVLHDLFLLFIVEAIYEVAISNKMAPAASCKSSFARYIERPSSNQDEHDGHTSQHYIHQFLQMGRNYLSYLGSSQHHYFPNRWRRATQYHEAGIQFRMRMYSEHNPHSLLDIKLRDGILEIPFLFVDEETIVFFRNLIALEQTCPQVGNYVTAYTVFMAKLMSMPDDVALLARKGVIAHHMRTDRDVSQLFTRLTKGVVFDFYGNYYLNHLCLALEVYYQNRLHRWVAWLRHNHLSNPWLVVAAFAGVIVLFCTIAQTVLTVESYVNPK